MMGYEARNYLMICDRCGSQFRRSDMREHYTGLYLCTQYCWESQHPQDFVEGIEDDTTVPVARTDIPQTIGETTLNGALLKGSLTAVLSSVSGLSDKDPVGIVLDDGTVHWTFIDGTIVGTTIILNTLIPFAAASGNIVYKPSVNNENWT